MSPDQPPLPLEPRPAIGAPSPRTPPPPGAPAPRRRRWLHVVLAGVLIVALGTAAGGWYVLQRLESPFRGYEGTEQFVEIPQGLGANAIGARLVAAGVVRDRWTFRLAMWKGGRTRALRAGEYRFDRPLTPQEVIDTLAKGEVYLQPITFPEGLTVRDMAAIFAAKQLGSAEEFIRAAGQGSLVRDLDPGATDLEGYLFPDTYNVARRVTAADLVRAMVDRFREAAGPDLAARASGAGRSVRELVTLASIVEKETGKPDERRMVAAVYANRLRIGMGLQCDPTVIYALQKAGRWNGNLTRDDLQMDSPYNTYRYAGLPPGPIASPGKASIDAALAPADAPYLYFVSRNDGSHAFATTLAEHNENVREFQIQYFREKRARERGVR